MLMRASTLSIAHETAGAARTRHSLRPLISGGTCYGKNSGASRRGNALRRHSGARLFLGASPESILPNGGYGFRACAKRRIPE